MAGLRIDVGGFFFWRNPARIHSYLHRTFEGEKDLLLAASYRSSPFILVGAY